MVGGIGADQSIVGQANRGIVIHACSPFDLREGMFVRWIGEALAALVQTRNRVMRVVAASPREPDATIEVLIDETPMREAMIAFSVRILTLSIIISLRLENSPSGDDLLGWPGGGS